MSNIQASYKVIVVLVAKKKLLPAIEMFFFFFILKHSVVYKVSISVNMLVLPLFRLISAEERMELNQRSGAVQLHVIVIKYLKEARLVLKACSRFALKLHPELR